MSLAMSRPWKYPKTGVNWLRRRFPDEPRPIIGRFEEKRSLETHDPAGARRRHASALTEIEVRWANLRAGPP